MEFYFAKFNRKNYFFVIINNLEFLIFRVDIRNKIWSGTAKVIYIGQHFLSDDITEYNPIEQIWNSILLELEVNNENYKYMFIGRYVYSFESSDKIIYIFSNLGFNEVSYPACYGGNNIYYLEDRYKFIP